MVNRDGDDVVSMEEFLGYFAKCKCLPGIISSRVKAYAWDTCTRGVITPFFSGVGIGVGFMADSGRIGIAGIRSRVEFSP